MAGSIIGKLVSLSTFGESHGPAIGGVIDGFPANIAVDLDFIQSELGRRKPGQSALVTQRKEDDVVEFLSGIFEGKTTGTPIAFLIHNTDAKSKDYEHLKSVYRPSHADFTYQEKYGIRDHRGGGRSSARETAARVVAGAFAKLYLQSQGISFHAFVDQVGPIKMTKEQVLDYALPRPENNDVRCPDPILASEMELLIRQTKKDGDTIGGAISCFIHGVPVGLGEPIFDKLSADLAKAIFSIPAVKGFEIGEGFGAIPMYGSEHNDLFNRDKTTRTNHSGGIQGGISNGMPIYFRTAFKPVATLLKDQESIDSSGNFAVVQGRGRHDACVVPRAVVIVEAMAAWTILDHFIRAKLV